MTLDMYQNGPAPLHYPLCPGASGVDPRARRQQAGHVGNPGSPRQEAVAFDRTRGVPGGGTLRAEVEELHAAVRARLLVVRPPKRIVGGLTLKF